MNEHAILIIGDKIETSPLPEKLKKPAIDVRHFRFSNLTIGDARNISELSLTSPFASNEHVLVIEASTVGLEAQNALLKLFEEPPLDTVFYLVVPHESVLIPTLRSRFVKKLLADDASKSNEAMNFINLTYAERINYATDKSKNDPAALVKLVDALGKLPADVLGEEGSRSLFIAEKYIRNRGASRKILIEELALAVRLKNN